jgi:hypothetical protein
MLLALLALALVALVLAAPMIAREVSRRRAARKAAKGRDELDLPLYDPGRERRAEQRARQLLRSCVNDEEWEMYRDLGFIRVWGGLASGPEQGGTPATRAGAPYAYLIYPHKPVVA